MEGGEEKMVVEEKPELDINEENYHKRMAEAAEKSGQQEKAMLCDSATADVLSVTGDFGDMPELKDVSEHPDNDHVMDTSDNGKQWSSSPYSAGTVFICHRRHILTYKVDPRSE